MHENRELRELNISEVLPNRFQPRFRFDNESLEQLAESISKFGVIEPVVVRPVGKKYEIIAGERRYKASKIAGKSTIPAIIVNLSDKDSEELALLENVQRKSLNPIEEAVSYKRILDAGYIKREELAKKIGKPQTEILSKIRLLELSDEVQSSLLNNKISERHARSLLKLSDSAHQSEILHKIVNERLTVKQTDREIKKLLEDSPKKSEEVLSVSERGNKDMDLDKIMNEAQDINSVPAAAAPMPDLMAKGLIVPSEPIVSQDDQTVGGGADGKFIGSIPQEPTTQPAQPNVIESSNVTFDNMFNQPITSNDLPFNQPVVPSSSEVNNAGGIPDMNILQDGVSTDNSNVQPGLMPNMNNGSVIPTEQPGLMPDMNNGSVIPGGQPGLMPDMNNGNVIPTEQPGLMPDMNNGNVIPGGQPGLMPDMNNGSVIPGGQPGLMPDMNNGNVIPTVQPEPMPNNTQDFSAMIQMIRDCAEQIKSNGHSINVEEIDLGGQYKVTITIGK